MSVAGIQLTSSINNLKHSDRKLDDITIKKLTYNNPTMKEKFDEVNKRANKLLKDNSKAQENAFFAAAAKKEKAFFAESKKEIYEEGNKVVWKQNDDKKVEKRRRLLESKGKGAKIQC